MPSTKTVLVAEPMKPATAAAAVRLKRYRAAKVAQDVKPIRIRGRIATKGSLKSGIVARVKLSRPKARPVTMPTRGPSSTPPRIVGMCSIVALPERLGIGINPMPGMTPKMIVMATSTPAVTIRLVVSAQGPGAETSDVALLKMDPPVWGTQQLSYKLNGHKGLLTGEAVDEVLLHLLMMLLRTLDDVSSISAGLFHVKE